MASRRIYQEAPNHKLSTLVKFHNLKTDGVHHRALSDAEMTAHLWMKILADIREATGMEKVPFEVVQKLSAVPKSKVPLVMSSMRDLVR